MVTQTPLGWNRFDDQRMHAELRAAARQMAGLVRSTLGPHGLDKMIVRRMDDDSRRTFVSNDGVAIIEEFEGETNHPIARRFIGLAEDHETAFGDGTTTTVLLAAAFLEQGLDLIDDGLHPTTVVEGLSIGGQRTLEVWNDRRTSITEGPGETEGELDRKALATVARTGMTNGQDGSWPLHHVADELVEAVLQVSNRETGHVDIGAIDTRPITAGSVADSEVITGKYLLKEPLTAARLLPLSGGVLLVEGQIKPRELGMDTTVSDPGEGLTRKLATRKRTEMNALAEHIADAGVELVAAGEEIGYEMASALARHGVVSVEKVTRSDLAFLSSVTGAKPVSTVLQSIGLPSDAVGAAAVSMETDADREWMRILSRDDTPANAATFVVYGGTEHSADEAKRRIKDGMNAVRAAIKQPSVLPAGGAADIAAAESVRSLAPSIQGREQLAVRAFADALEVVPRTLSENAGCDPLDTVTTLRRYHADGHRNAGIAVDGTIAESITDRGGYDASLIRTSSLIRALEFANALLRVDQLLVDERPPRGV